MSKGPSDKIKHMIKFSISWLQQRGRGLERSSSPEKEEEEIPVGS